MLLRLFPGLTHNPQTVLARGALLRHDDTVDAITRMLTQLRAPRLTKAEKAHVAHGGRVFIVQEIPGPLWRVLAVSSKGCTLLLKPEGGDGYTERSWAVDVATGIANLSPDGPMVRE